MTPQHEKVLKKVVCRIETYHCIAIILRFTLIFFGLIGLVCGLFVPAFIDTTIFGTLTPLVVKIASLISAISLTSLSAFNVTGKGNNARNAFRYLDNAYSLFLLDKIEPEKLVAEMDTAEKIMGSVDFQSTVIPKRQDENHK